MSDIQTAQGLNTRIGESFNQYFTWSNNTAFYMLAPTYLFQFYNTQMRIWDEWNVGWVQNFHDSRSGILPTQLAGSLCNKLGTLINGEGILFESDEDKNSISEDDSIDFIGRIDKIIDIKGVVRDSIIKSVKLGNSLIKINCDENGEYWLDSLAGNRFFVDLNSRGKIQKVKTYVNIYTTGLKEVGKPSDSYGLVEERYYGEDGKVYGEYKIYKLAGAANIFDPNVSGNSYDYKNLPRSIQTVFREQYSKIILNQPEELPLRSLGVYLIKHTEYVNAMPNIKMGESALAQIINYLPQYDAVNSEALIDIRLSRPKIGVPTFMTKGKKDNSDELINWNDILFAKIPNMSDKDQSPTVFLPIPREKNFARMREEIAKKICANIGVSTTSIFSDISDARGNVTAREISSEESNTVLYITEKRKIILKPLNEMISDLLYCYGKKESVKITFAPAGVSNKSVNTDIITKLYQSNLISQYQAIKEQHSEWTDKQIIEEINEINSSRENAELYKVEEVKDPNPQDSEDDTTVKTSASIDIPNGVGEQE